MPKYPDDYYLTQQEIEDLRTEAKHAAKYMKAFLISRSKLVTHLV